MKASVVALCLFSALAFAFAAIVEFAGFFLLHALPTSALVGGLAAGCVFALALRDYARKPSLRVRRPSAPATDSAFEAAQDTATAQLDWTYAPRSA